MNLIIKAWRSTRGHPVFQGQHGKPLGTAVELEADLERIKVSQAAGEFQQYRMRRPCKDAQLVGGPAGRNPFREPRSCAFF